MIFFYGLDQRSGDLDWEGDLPRNDVHSFLLVFQIHQMTTGLRWGQEVLTLVLMAWKSHVVWTVAFRK